MLIRKIDTYIENFYSTTNKALLLTGARQVGKSYTITKYAKSHYTMFVECNFVKEPDLVKVFNNVKNETDIINRLQLFKQETFTPNQTFIFFDEIQKCPDVLTWIKFLVQDGRFRYALSGSLLGLELNNVRSLPVGYIGEATLYPLDFEEFLYALGINAQVIDNLRECWEEKKPVDEFIHNQVLKLFHLYLITGGMPAVVQKYVDTNDLLQVENEQKDILKLYKHDISQYNKSKQLKVNEIFDLIPSELNAQNKRFIFKSLKESARFDAAESNFLWLKNADMALPVYNVDAPISPLKLNEKRNLFKLFQNDVGLLSSQYASGIQLRILQGETNINFGAIYENAVAQELHAHGFNLYYFTSKKQGELDFLLESDAKITPIEVKSGKFYERHNALSNILSTQEYNINNAIVLYNNNLQVKNTIVYAPIYMIMFIQKAITSKELIYKADLTGLTNTPPHL